MVIYLYYTLQIVRDSVLLFMTGCIIRSRLFVTPFYSNVLLEQSLLFNRRRRDAEVKYNNRGIVDFILEDAESKKIRKVAALVKYLSFCLVDGHINWLPHINNLSTKIRILCSPYN